MLPFQSLNVSYDRDAKSLQLYFAMCVRKTCPTLFRDCIDIYIYTVYAEFYMKSFPVSSTDFFLHV